MKLAPSTRGLTGKSLELAAYIVMLWAPGSAGPWEAWSRTGRYVWDLDTRRWRLVRDGVQVPQGEVRT